MLFRISRSLTEDVGLSYCHIRRSGRVQKMTSLEASLGARASTVLPIHTG